MARRPRSDRGVPRRPLTDEEKKRISEATKAAMARPEVKERYRAAMNSPEVREKIRTSKLGESNPMYGKHPSIETREKRRASMAGRHVGEDNPAFKGAAASLSAIHIWLRRRDPLTGVCSRCAEQKRTERAFLRWPAPYTRDPVDYAEMCRRCHMRFDFESGQRQPY